MEEQQSSNPTTSSATLPSFGNLLSEAWNAFLDRWQLYVMLMLILAVLQLIAGYILPGENLYLNSNGWSTMMFDANDIYTEPFTAGQILFTILISIVALILQSSLLYAITHRDADVTVSSALQHGLRKSPSYLLVAILVGLAVLGGFILIIIPGIVFWIWFSFSSYVLFRENKAGVSALKRSKELVRGYWWPIFWRLLGLFALIAVFSGAIALIPVVGLLLTTIIIGPISALFSVLMYEHRLQHFTA